MNLWIFFLFEFILFMYFWFLFVLITMVKSWVADKKCFYVLYFNLLLIYCSMKEVILTEYQVLTHICL